MEAFIGTILPWAGNWEPQGWAFCDGRQLTVNQYQALFAVLGNTYGGDGKTTFNLPDLRGRVPLGVGQLQPTGGRYVNGQKGGAENVNVTNQLPSHTHTFSAQAAVNVGTPYNAGGTLTNTPSPTTCLGTAAMSTGGTAKPNIYSTSAPNATMATLATTATLSGTTGATGAGTAGSTQAIDNRQPFLSVNYIICLIGIWPDRG